MTFFEKHRLGLEDFQVEQADQLASSETLSGNPTVTVTVWDPTTGKWVSTASQFPVSGEGTDGTKSVFKLGVAPDNNAQARGLYRVNVSQATSGGETLHSEVVLYVRDWGDVNAPTP